MIQFRKFAVFAIIGLVTACASAGPTESVLSEASRTSITIKDVDVDYSRLGDRTMGQNVPISTVKSIFDREAAQLVGAGTGSVPARLIINFESVNLISAGQSIMVGGESVMKGDVSLVNARDGSVIIPSTSIDAGGGGWVMGGLIGAASRDDPPTEIQQMSDVFITRIRTLIFGA